MTRWRIEQQSQVRRGLSSLGSALGALEKEKKNKREKEYERDRGRDSSDREQILLLLSKEKLGWGGARKSFDDV
jgi:hypothetical protein